MAASFLLEFQFLIGSLKTKDNMGWADEIVGFQFLIGSLKTNHGGTDCGSYCYVSIPHRQSKNYTILEGAAVTGMFQFLIGSLKTYPYLT